MSKKAQVIFVDGPNGVGKDFFIDGMEKTLLNNALELSISKIRITDHFPKQVESELRKYTVYDTEKEQLLHIFAAHVKILDMILRDAKSHDVILVNRSFLSMLAYNLYKKEYVIERAFYVDMYNALLFKYTEFLDISFIYLQAPILDIQKRQIERNEGKKMDAEWAVALTANYNQAVKTFASLSKSIYPTFSGEYMSFADKVVRAIQANELNSTAKELSTGSLAAAC